MFLDTIKRIIGLKQTFLCDNSGKHILIELNNFANKILLSGVIDDDTEIALLKFLSYLRNWLRSNQEKSTDSILARQEKIELLVDRSESSSKSSVQFRERSKK